MTISLAEVTLDLFRKYEKQGFTLVNEGDAGVDPVECELIEVRSLGRFPNGRREQFSVLFLGREHRTLAPGLHTLKHAEFELNNLFINRVQLLSLPPGETVVSYYEAVFS